MSSFDIFYYTSRSVNDCCNAMDEPPRMNYRSDAEEGDIACRQCQFCIWPIIIPFDIISCPFRGIYHIVKKCTKKDKKENTNNKKN